MPRPMLMKNALRFIRWKRARCMNPSVSGVWGTVRMTKSARGRSASSASGPSSLRSPGGASRRRASTPITFIPNSAASRAVSAPIPPTPDDEGGGLGQVDHAGVERPRPPLAPLLLGR